MLMSKINIEKLNKGKQNQYDLIARMFVSTSSIKKELTRPFRKGNKIYATDSFMAIQIDDDLVGGEYTESSDDPKADVLFEKIRKESTYRFAIDQLLGMMSAYDIKIEMTGLQTKCEECDGSGDDECYECGHWKECESCNGSGKGNDQPSRVKVDFDSGNKWNGIGIEDLRINAQFLGTALIAMRLSGSEHVDLIEEKDRLIIRNNAGMTIIIMAISQR